MENIYLCDYPPTYIHSSTALNELKLHSQIQIGSRLYYTGKLREEKKSNFQLDPVESNACRVLMSNERERDGR